MLTAQDLYLDDKANPLRPLWVWRPPSENKYYVVGADAAEGTGSDYSDYSAAQVLDAVTCEQVAEFHCKYTDPIQFAYKLAKLGIFYGGKLGYAKIIPEINTHGATTCKVLLEAIGYPNVWRTRTYNREPGQKLGIWTDQYGWRTLSLNRDIPINHARAIFRDHPNIVRSSRLLKELQTFVYERKKHSSVERAQAQGKKKDDLVWAWVLALYAREYALKEMRPDQIDAPERHKDSWIWDRFEEMDKEAEWAKGNNRTYDPRYVHYTEDHYAGWSW